MLPCVKDHPQLVSVLSTIRPCSSKNTLSFPTLDQPQVTDHLACRHPFRPHTTFVSFTKPVLSDVWPFCRFRSQGWGKSLVLDLEECWKPLFFGGGWDDAFSSKYNMLTFSALDCLTFSVTWLGFVPQLPDSLWPRRRGSYVHRRGEDMWMSKTGGVRARSRSRGGTDVFILAMYLKRVI